MPVFFTVVSHAANDIRGGVGFGFALSNAHDHGDRFGLLGNRPQRMGQCTGFTRLAAGGQHIGQQDRGI
ncbi:hypothetical protein Xbud_03626 [Xenorhabdus budapestensis]|uniref:Uncharacterized protein n=1 Tax=Xenorhabdus budapestensis TaxID=290110 RepID=A0A2D0IN51_XENBU|nr:hypothetical protein Xbud_03626 [Xenorhabdus budapestensis]